MPNLYRVVLTLAATLAAAPLVAQVRTGGRGAPPTTPPVAASTTQQQPAGKPMLDFQDQQIRIVIQALAEAGGVNISLTSMPTATITLHMSPAATKDEIIANIKAIADGNGIRWKETAPGTLILTGPPPPLSPQAAQAAAQQKQQDILDSLNKQSIHIYQLKHNTAATLAPVLTALFQAQNGGRGGGGGGVGGAAANNGGRGGAANNAARPGGAAGGGRGGGAAGGGGGGGGGRGGGTDLLGASMVDPSATSSATNPVTTYITTDIYGYPIVALDLSQAGRGGAAAQAPAQNPILQALGLGGAALQVGANQVLSPRISPDPATNSLMILASDADWLKIQQVLQAIDLRPMQVLIEVAIAEVTTNESQSLGMSGRLAHKSGLQSDTLKAPSAAAARDLIMTLVGSQGAVDYNVAFNALQSMGTVKVLSHPTIIAQNNLQAFMNVGAQVPAPTAVTTANTTGVPVSTTTYGYVNAGTQLTITPTIDRDGYVNLVIDQTNNNAVIDPNGSGIYVINQREASTTVYLKSGQTTVLGGLSASTTSKQTGGIPILDKIPFIGPWLFGNRQTSTVSSELYLFLTPHVISDDTDIDQLRDAVKAGTKLLKDVPTGSQIKVKPDTTERSHR